MSTPPTGEDQPIESQTIEERIAQVASPAERRLYRSMVDTVAGLIDHQTEVIDLKVADTALSEMAEAFAVFQPLRKRMKVTIFGSARTEADHPAYRQARALAAAMSGAGWMVVTGAGPGIMAAGMEGAGRDQSIQKDEPGHASPLGKSRAHAHGHEHATTPTRGPPPMQDHLVGHALPGDPKRHSSRSPGRSPGPGRHTE